MKLFLTFFFLLFLGFSLPVFAQLGFCGGNSGEPIFTETFGTGTNIGPPLPPGTTTYQFVTNDPQDGQYTIASNSGFLDWHNTGDRTPGDTNGKMLIVNADFDPGEFFRITVDGLCQGTSYEFSAWLLNLLPPSRCGGNGIPINVGFQIWDSTDSILLASGSTGPVGGTVSPVWNQHGLVFQTQAGQEEVILKMINNGQGGCGNDLAIDDIVFKSCGDSIDITDSSNSNIFLGCTNTASAVELTANPDFSVFQSHAYQWQLSNDGNNWLDISGANNQSYTANPSQGTTFYRVKVAEEAANLQNDLCNVISDVFQLSIDAPPEAPISNGDVTDCGTADVSLIVNVPNDILVNWFDVPSGGNAITSNTNTFVTNTPSTYYAEAVTTLAGCSSLSRTPVSFSRISPPTGEDFVIEFCEDSLVTLESAFQDIVSYTWNTGETTPQIVVNTPGLYTVNMVNTEGCEITSQFTVDQSDAPNAPISLGDIAVCSDNAVILQVEANPNITVNWFSLPSGGNLLLEDSFSYSTDVEGTFYAEAVSSEGCRSLSRTGVNFTKLNPPPGSTQTAIFCQGSFTELNVDLNNLASFNWSTGATTETITVNNPGTYFVDVVNTDDCETRYIFEVSEIPNPQPPTSLGDVVNCSGEVGTLTVEVPDGMTVNWYDSPNNGNLLEENSNSITVDIEGTFYAEAISINGNCISTSRTAVNFSRLDPLDFTDEIIYLCQGTQIILGIEIQNNISYNWSTGDTTPEISVGTPGNYSVNFVNANGCEATKNFEVIQVNPPVIFDVITNEFDIEIISTETGDFSYSIDGQNFQYGNIFYGIRGGRYTITVRDNFECGLDVVSHLHFVIPKFFTPNNDGFNDFFEIRGIQEFGNSEVNIFDRYGKLLKSYKNSPVVWDGTYLGNLLPTNDYWYQIIIDGEEFSGHFTLKR